jgi:hypothetical protein
MMNEKGNPNRGRNKNTMLGMQKEGRFAAPQKLREFPLITQSHSGYTGLLRKTRHTAAKQATRKTWPAEYTGWVSV